MSKFQKIQVYIECLKESYASLSASAKLILGQETCQLLENINPNSFEDFYKLTKLMDSQALHPQFNLSFKKAMLNFSELPIVRLYKLFSPPNQLTNRRQKLKKIFLFQFLQDLFPQLFRMHSIKKFLATNANTLWNNLIDAKLNEAYFRFLDLILNRLAHLTGKMNISDHEILSYVLTNEEQVRYEEFILHIKTGGYIHALNQLRVWDYFSQAGALDALKGQVKRSDVDFLHHLKLLIDDTPPGLPKQLLQKNITLLIEQEVNPNEMIEILLVLMDWNRLNERYQEWLGLQFNILPIYNFLKALKYANIFNQKNCDDVFLTIMKHSEILFSSTSIMDIWVQIVLGDLIFEMKHWEELKRICEHSANIQIAKIRIQHFFHRLGYTTGSIQINSEQSTHHASVHETAIESALVLKQHYEAKLTPAIEQLIFDWISHEEHPYLHSIQKTLSILLTNPFQEQVSGLNLGTLLSLVWLAMHDEQLRVAELSDCKSMLLRGLYDIARGNNMSENFIDNGLADQGICSGGAFNKLIECMVSTHPDFKMNFVFNSILSYKLPIITRQCVMDYFQIFLQGQYVDFPAILGLIIMIQKEGISIIWHDISPQVQEKTVLEFGSLFSSQPSKKFKELLACAEFTDLSQLQMQKQLANSHAYHRYLSKIIFFKPAWSNQNQFQEKDYQIAVSSDI